MLSPKPNLRWVAALLCLALALPSPVHAMRVETPLEAGAEERLSQQLNPAAGAEELKDPPEFLEHQREVAEGITKSWHTYLKILLDSDGLIEKIQTGPKGPSSLVSISSRSYQEVEFTSEDDEPRDYRVLGFHSQSGGQLHLVNVWTGRLVRVSGEGEVIVELDPSGRHPRDEVRRAFQPLLEDIGKGELVSEFEVSANGVTFRYYPRPTKNWRRIIFGEKNILTSSKFESDAGETPAGAEERFPDPVNYKQHDFQVIRTHFTYLNRDLGQQKLLAEEILPDLVRRNASSRAITVAFLGISTGEEMARFWHWIRGWFKERGLSVSGPAGWTVRFIAVERNSVLLDMAKSRFAGDPENPFVYWVSGAGLKKDPELESKTSHWAKTVAAAVREDSSLIRESFEWIHGDMTDPQVISRVSRDSDLIVSNTASNYVQSPIGEPDTAGALWNGLLASPKAWILTTDPLVIIWPSLLIGPRRSVREFRIPASDLDGNYPMSNQYYLVNPPSPAAGAEEGRTVISLAEGLWAKRGFGFVDWHKTDSLKEPAALAHFAGQVGTKGLFVKLDVQDEVSLEAIGQLRNHLPDRIIPVALHEAAPTAGVIARADRKNLIISAPIKAIEGVIAEVKKKRAENRVLVIAKVKSWEDVERAARAGAQGVEVEPAVAAGVTLEQTIALLDRIAKEGNFLVWGSAGGVTAENAQVLLARGYIGFSVDPETLTVRSLGFKSSKPSMADGRQKAGLLADGLVASGREITEEDLAQLNAALRLRPAVRYRKGEAFVRDYEGRVLAFYSHPEEVPQQMKDFIEWINAKPGSRRDPRATPSLQSAILNDRPWVLGLDDPATHAAMALWLFHHVIHPYQDGHTRTGWLLMNILRRRGGLEPLQFDRHEDYLKTFNAEKEPSPLLEFMRQLAAAGAEENDFPKMLSGSQGIQPTDQKTIFRSEDGLISLWYRVAKGSPRSLWISGGRMVLSETKSTPYHLYRGRRRLLDLGYRSPEGEENHTVALVHDRSDSFEPLIQQIAYDSERKQLSLTLAPGAVTIQGELPKILTFDVPAAIGKTKKLKVRFIQPNPPPLLDKARMELLVAEFGKTFLQGQWEGWLSVVNRLVRAGPQGVPVLLEVLHALESTEKKPLVLSRVRLGLAQVFGQIGPASAPAVPDLLRFLSEDTNSVVRQTVQEALEKIHPPAAGAEETVQALVEEKVREEWVVFSHNPQGEAFGFGFDSAAKSALILGKRGGWAVHFHADRPLRAGFAAELIVEGGRLKGVGEIWVEPLPISALTPMDERTMSAAAMLEIRSRVESFLLGERKQDLEGGIASITESGEQPNILARAVTPGEEQLYIILSPEMFNAEGRSTPRSLPALGATVKQVIFERLDRAAGAEEEPVLALLEKVRKKHGADHDTLDQVERVEQQWRKVPALSSAVVENWPWVAMSKRKLSRLLRVDASSRAVRSELRDLNAHIAFSLNEFLEAVPLGEGLEKIYLKWDVESTATSRRDRQNDQQLIETALERLRMEDPEGYERVKSRTQVIVFRRIDSNLIATFQRSLLGYTLLAWPFFRSLRDQEHREELVIASLTQMAAVHRFQVEWGSEKERRVGSPEAYGYLMAVNAYQAMLDSLLRLGSKLADQPERLPPLLLSAGHSLEAVHERLEQLRATQENADLSGAGEHLLAAQFRKHKEQLQLFAELSPAGEVDGVPVAFWDFQRSGAKWVNRNKRMPYHMDLDDMGRVINVFTVKNKRGFEQEYELVRFTSPGEDEGGYRLLTLLPSRKNPKRFSLLLVNVRTGRFVRVYPSGKWVEMREAVPPQVPEHEIRQAMRTVLDTIAREEGIHGIWFLDSSVKFTFGSGKWIKLNVAKDSVWVSAGLAEGGLEELMDAAREPVREIAERGERIAVLVGQGVIPDAAAADLEAMAERLRRLNGYPMIDIEPLTEETRERFSAAGAQVIQLKLFDGTATTDPDTVYLQAAAGMEERISIRAFPLLVTDAVAHWRRAQGRILPAPIVLPAAPYLNAAGAEEDDFADKILSNRFA